MDGSGRQNADLIMFVRTMGSAFVSTATNAGEVDYMSDDAVEERRKAMGPIGRKRW